MGEEALSFGLSTSYLKLNGRKTALSFSLSAFS
jgi:hypothetical protein